MRVLITGGNSGIGLAIAKQLKEDGHEVLTPDKKELDVGNYRSVRTYFYEKQFDLLINCAGFIQTEKIKQSCYWFKHISINLKGVYLTCSEILEQDNNPIIINIASTSGLKGRAGWSAYCASKAGVISFTQSLADEGYKAYCISPGRTKTKMRKGLFPNEDQSTLLDPQKIADIVKLIIAGKYNPGDNIIVKKDEQIKTIPINS